MTRYKAGYLFGSLMLLLAAPVPIARFQNASAPFPSRLGTYLRDVVGSPAEEQRQLAAGEPVTKLLDTDETKEVAILGAVWINAPMHRYIQAVWDIETFERGGGFKITKRISSPPQLTTSRVTVPREDSQICGAAASATVRSRSASKRSTVFGRRSTGTRPNAPAAAQTWIQRSHSSTRPATSRAATPSLPSIATAPARHSSRRSSGR